MKQKDKLYLILLLIPEFSSETNEFRICLDVQKAFYNPYTYIGALL